MLSELRSVARGHGCSPRGHSRRHRVPRARGPASPSCTYGVCTRENKVPTSTGRCWLGVHGEQGKTTSPEDGSAVLASSLERSVRAQQSLPPPCIKNALKMPQKTKPKPNPRLKKNACFLTHYQDPPASEAAPAHEPKRSLPRK